MGIRFLISHLFIASPLKTLNTLARWNIFAALALGIALPCCQANAQASATASRLTEAQVGGGYIAGQSDYARSYFNGYSIYADLDFRNHLGAEVAYHHMGDGDSYTHETESSYEIGARYSRHYGRFQPYGKFMFGRGVFNFKLVGVHNTSNLFAYGGGVDVRVLRSINLRAEYEQQNWFDFPPNGLSPSLATVGIAYHFK